MTEVTMVNSLHLSKSRRGFSFWTIYHLVYLLINLQVSYPHKLITEAQPVQTPCKVHLWEGKQPGKNKEQTERDFLGVPGVPLTCWLLEMVGLWDIFLTRRSFSGSCTRLWISASSTSVSTGISARTQQLSWAGCPGLQSHGGREGKGMKGTCGTKRAPSWQTSQM